MQQVGIGELARARDESVHQRVRGVPTPSPSTEERGATILLRTLAKRGIRKAFGIPGGAIGPMFDALAEVPEIEFVPTRHEAIAVFAAIGHARVTGMPALVLVTSGPGITNAVTGVAAALLEEEPVIVIGGEVATSSVARAAFQEGSTAGLDVVSLMRSVTRWSATVAGSSHVAGAAERAFAFATGEQPGPVFLSVPLDVAQAPSAGVPVATPLARRPLPDAEACLTAAHYLAAAKRPLLVLGNGARKASQPAVRFAERLQLPVVATGHAKGVFPERHPLYLGLIGNAGHPSATEYIAAGPDVVCVVGSRVGDFATNGWRCNLTGEVATIQVDRDPMLIGRNARVTLGIVSDAAIALEAMADMAPPRAAARRPRVARRVHVFANEPAMNRIKPEAALQALSRAFPDAIWCSDIGEHMGFAWHYLVVDHPHQFHAMSGLGSMGSGFGAAIGIKHAKPDATVVAIVGDGGFNMHAGEILTCVEQRVGVVFAIFNDGCWNMVEHGLRATFQRGPANLAHQTADLARVACGYGARAVTVTQLEQLESGLLRKLACDDCPLVLDIRIDASQSLSVESRAAAITRAAGIGKDA